MLWLSIIVIFLVIVSILLFFIPLIFQCSLQIDEEINLDLKCKLGFIPIYSKEYRFLISEFFDDYIQPYLVKKNQRSPVIIKKIKLKQFNWSSKIGFEYANATALSMSLLMIIKSIMAQMLISYYDQPLNISYHVNPDYHQPGFETDCQCIFSIKVGQAIYVKLKGNN
ncbi:hypothetical protein KQI76_00700 [Amphibacillus sp. MSJ-3]|uniref:hypothetical protein n=1 Tax=Amphibacillus sp. MSJ-3 TaxID=2841505 RepID=UPI001C0EFFC2|nr:hypothetical protein [Amphibacillus sp. MSJ-3]MBU5593677.1 hypothetical protein [Amphibacillus sp. MSJ-3]